MEILDRLDDVNDLVESAKALPLSQSCVVPRPELLDLLDDVRAALPESLREADLVLRQRDDIITDARLETERLTDSAHDEATRIRGDAQDEADRSVYEAKVAAERIITDARVQAERLTDSHAITLAAQDEAARLLAEARAEARRVTLQAEAQGAALMASAEDALEVALVEVRRRREHLRPAVSEPVIQGSQYASYHPADDFFDLESAGGLEGQHGSGRRGR